jgi:hypothetical protein
VKQISRFTRIGRLKQPVERSAARATPKVSPEFR